MCTKDEHMHTLAPKLLHFKMYNHQAYICNHQRHYKNIHTSSVTLAPNWKGSNVCKISWICIFCYRPTIEYNAAVKNNKLLLLTTCMNITNVMSKKRITLYDSIYLKFTKSEMTSGVSGLQSGHL